MFWPGRWAVRMQWTEANTTGLKTDNLHILLINFKEPLSHTTKSPQTSQLVESERMSFICLGKIRARGNSESLRLSTMVPWHHDHCRITVVRRHIQKIASICFCQAQRKVVWTLLESSERRIAWPFKMHDASIEVTCWPSLRTSWRHFLRDKSDLKKATFYSSFQWNGHTTRIFCSSLDQERQENSID